MKLSPYDLGEIKREGVLESFVKIKVDDLVKQVNKGMKKSLLELQLEVFDQEVTLTTTKTRFGGEKYWFVCPTCSRRAGVLYQDELGSCKCRKCMSVLYLLQKNKLK